ncbi:MAG: efflux transporter outer membrane subunit [Alphaproteobacteria bacterium]|nr:efflux transporter outer membrane subunit [Alphaproteobacteria bacterium]
MMHAKPLAGLLATLLLSACVSTPPTDPQVSQVKTETLGLGDAPMAKVAPDWWRAFGDPQVDRLAPQVIAQNPSLAAAMARLRAAQAQLSVNQAQDMPQVTLDGSEQRLLFSKDYIIPPPYGGSYRWYGQVLGNFSWNLDFWGKQAALIDKARGTAQAAALDVEAAHLALSGAFAQGYISLLLNYQNGDIADATVAEREGIVKITQGRVDAGLENPSALEQAKALLAIARAEQLRYQAARETDVHAIAALAGEGADAYAGITRPVPDLDAALPLPTSLPADLLARRPDILAARARIDAAMAGRKAAHAAFYPDINLAAMVGFQAIGLSNLISSDAFTYGAGPAIHLPIFDAGKLRAEYAGATAGLDEAVADYNGAVVNAIKQVADAMTQVKSLEQQRLRQKEAVDSAARAFQIAQDRYRSGLSTQLPMLEAESTLLQARQALAAATAQSVIQRITLLLTTGGPFNTPAATHIAKQD